MINENYAKSYCRDDISLIENYGKAIADTTQIWHCHHRRETIYSRLGLLEIGEYYNRPAEELIFLTKSDHNKVHHLGKPLSEDTCKKISESLNGKPAWNKGKHHSAEARKKMSESKKGENNPMFGKHHSAEARKKMSDTMKGKTNLTKGTQWFNDGTINTRAKTCPEGFVPGRIVCNKRP